MARVAVVIAVVLCVVVGVRVGADSSPQGAQRARIDAAARAWALADADWRSGRGTLDSVYVWSVRWLDAERDNKNKAPAAALKAHAQRMQTIEAFVKARYEKGASGTYDVAAAEFYRLDAEALLNKD